MFQFFQLNSSILLLMCLAIFPCFGAPIYDCSTIDKELRDLWGKLELNLIGFNFQQDANQPDDMRELFKRGNSETFATHEGK